MQQLKIMTKRNKGRKANNHSTMMKALLGHKMRPSPHPPEFTAVPWWPLCVRIQNPAASITKAVLRDNIQSQLGFTTSYVMDVRLQSVQLWGALSASLGSSFLNPVTLAVIDPITTAVAAGVAPVLDVLTDYPDQVNRAAVGYKYSIAQRNVSIRLDNAQLLYSCQGVGPGAIMYVRVFWRSPNANIQNLGEDPRDNRSPSSDWQYPIYQTPTAPVAIPGSPYAHVRGQIQHM